MAKKNSENKVKNKRKKQELIYSLFYLFAVILIAVTVFRYLLPSLFFLFAHLLFAILAVRYFLFSPFQFFAILTFAVFLRSFALSLFSNIT